VTLSLAANKKKLTKKCSYNICRYRKEKIYGNLNYNKENGIWGIALLSYLSSFLLQKQKHEELVCHQPVIASGLAELTDRHIPQQGEVQTGQRLQPGDGLRSELVRLIRSIYILCYFGLTYNKIIY
jgi:hypothetical protein